MAAVCRTAPRAGELYGYLPGELIGQPAGSLVPDSLRAAHVSQRPSLAPRRAADPTQSLQVDLLEPRGRFESVAAFQRPWMRGIRGRTLTVALLMTELEPVVS